MSNPLSIESIEQMTPAPEAAKIDAFNDRFDAMDRAGGTLWEYANAPARICMSARDFWSALSDATSRPGGDVDAEGIHWIASTR